MLKNLLFAGILGVALAPAAALACGGSKTVTSVTVKEATADKPSFVDANGPETRDKMGVIPGAILLTSFDGFDATKELPKDKRQKLVFYCANEMCGASKVAASRAQDAGYQNVAVLPVGIKGWKAAGQKTAKAAAKKRS